MSVIKIKAKQVVKKKKIVKITSDFIRLDAALKLCGAVQTGGQAKMLIGDEQVRVNGKICIQRGKKLREGDRFSFGDTEYTITNPSDDGEKQV